MIQKEKLVKRGRPKKATRNVKELLQDVDVNKFHKFEYFYFSLFNMNCLISVKRRHGITKTKWY